MQRTVMFGVGCVLLAVATAAWGYTGLSSSKIAELTAFAAENSNANQLIVKLENGAECNGRDTFALMTAGAANQAAAALLTSAYLNDRLVGLEVDPSALINNRCKIVSVFLK